MIDRFETFSYAIAEISRCWHRIATDEMRKHGLKGPHAVFFTALYRHRDGLTAAELCTICAKDKAEVSRAVTQLEAQGLMKKGEQNQNRYRAKIKLTESGLALAEEINVQAKRAVEFGGEGLSEDERQVFYKALTLISENLKKLDQIGL
ncbi:MAG: winged helix-turn-helix transcriptional regulator [Clostridia bacterium]|nr:winged helix-turn-helix transcriptional regulator [Clostridia bacterium]